MRSKITGLLALLLCAVASASAKEIWAKSFIGKKAPPLVVEKWLTPKPAMEGKFILVDFWATWCGPCLEAIPELNQIQQEFGARVCVVGVSDERETTVRRMTAPRMSYAVAIDTKAKMKKAVEVRGIPHAMLIDPQGIVRWEGYPLLEGEELTSKVVREIVAKYDVK